MLLLGMPIPPIPIPPIPIPPMPTAPILFPNFYGALLLLFLLPELIPLPEIPPIPMLLFPLFIRSFPPELGFMLFPKMFIAFFLFIFIA